MRTVFVNPSSSGRRRRRRASSPKKRRRSTKRYQRVSGAMYRRSNPDMGAMLRQTSLLAAGAAAGALLNRLGVSHITNFYMRNGARLVAAALLTTVRTNPLVGIAAAGAVLAPMVPEIEMQMSTITGTKNPGELAAELSAMLEADLSDGDLSDGEDLSDGDELSDLLEDGELAF